MAKNYKQAMQEFETIYKDVVGYESSIREYMDVSRVMYSIFTAYEVTELHIFTQQEFEEYNKNEDEFEYCPDAYFKANNNTYYFSTDAGVIRKVNNEKTYIPL